MQVRNMVLLDLAWCLTFLTAWTISGESVDEAGARADAARDKRERRMDSHVFGGWL